MSYSKLNILAISGSLREGSLNAALLKAAQEIAPDKFEIEIYDGLATLPIFSQDLEGSNLPAPVGDLDHSIRTADAVLISTPEYNGATPGGLKNLLDWGSRPRGNGALNGKPVAVIGASPSPYGAARSVDMTSNIVAASGGVVVERNFTLGGAPSRFNSDGILVDEVAKNSLVDVLDGLATSAGDLLAAI